MSRTTDKSLARSVYKILSSDVNGSFVSSCIECQDKLDNLRPGTDIHLRDHARSCLKENLGWIDSAGKLVQEEYPRVRSLLKRLRRTNRSAPGSRLFLSQTPSPTIPEPQAVAELERWKLNTILAKKGQLPRPQTKLAQAYCQTGFSKRTTEWSMDGLFDCMST